MYDIEKVMSWLDGLTQDDWRELYSDSEVQNVAKAALELLEEYKEKKDKERNPCEYCQEYECDGCPYADK